MSESRQRKLNEPFYGKKPKGGRGIMMVPMFYESNKVGEVSAASYLTPEQIRFGLLFWDRIAWPSTPFLDVDDHGEFGILHSAGILLRPEAKFLFTSMSAGKSLADSYFQTFMDLEKTEPGRWCLSTETEADIRSFLNNDVLPDRGLTVSLHRAIPIPSRDAPLEEILEFKSRRESELLALRSEINDCASIVSVSPDRAEALVTQVDKIDAACTDLLRVTRESKFSIRLSDISFTSEITGANILSAITAGELLSHSYNLSSVEQFMGSIGLLAAGGLKLTKSFGMRNSLRRKSPYRYVYQLHEEVNWQ